jgi:hypothetical protein
MAVSIIIFVKITNQPSIDHSKSILKRFYSVAVITSGSDFPCVHTRNPTGPKGIIASPGDPGSIPGRTYCFAVILYIVPVFFCDFSRLSERDRGRRGLGRWLQTEAGELCADSFSSPGIDRRNARGWVRVVILFLMGRNHFGCLQKPATRHSTTIDHERSLRPVDCRDHQIAVVYVLLCVVVNHLTRGSSFAERRIGFSRLHNQTNWHMRGQTSKQPLTIASITTGQHRQHLHVTPSCKIALSRSAEYSGNSKCCSCEVIDRRTYSTQDGIAALKSLIHHQRRTTNRACRAALGLCWAWKRSDRKPFKARSAEAGEGLCS